MEPRWHGSVGYTLTDRYGTYCGYLGESYPCDSYEDGIKHALAWLRKHIPCLDRFLIHTFKLEVKYF